MPAAIIIEWKQARARRRYTSALSVFLILLLAVGAAKQCGVNLADLATGIAKGVALLGLFLPPDLGSAAEMLPPAAITLVLALSASILGSLIAIFIALAAASNVAPAWVRLPVRLAIGVERGVPEIVMLLFCVAVFGVGIFPGLLALTIASAGMLSKLLADSIEEAEREALESVRATGASQSQVIRYGIVPQILPSFLANSIFRFEVNVRASVLLGAVGAGGIGYELNASMAALEYRRAAVAILITVLIVFVSERISDALRKRILSGAGAR